MFWDDWFGKKTNTQIMLLRPRDKRFRDIEIVNQTDTSLETPKEKGITRFFIKKHAGWTNEKKGAARFFGLEGFDFTLKTKDTEEAVIGLYDAVNIVLGDQTMKIITPDIKQKLEAAKIGVTTEPITRDGIDRPNEGNENQFSEADKALIKAKGEATAKAGKSGKFDLTTFLLGGFCFAFITTMLFVMKVIKL